MTDWCLTTRRFSRRGAEGNLRVLQLWCLEFLVLEGLTASSHLAGRTEGPNPKLLSRGEDRSSLKYIINVLLSDSEYFIEKKFDLLTRV